jgi:hypothetical protein
MTKHLVVLLAVVSMLVTAADCDESQAGRADKPAVLEVRFAVSSHQPNLDDLDRIIRLLGERGPDDAPDTVEWLPLHDVEYWLRSVRQRERNVELTADDLPQLEETTRRLIVRPHGERMYLLVHATPPKMPEDVEQVESLTVEDARIGADANNRPAVTIELDAPSGRWMGKVTAPHVGQMMAMVIDGEVVGAYTLMSQIGRRLQLAGTFSRAELEILRMRLLGRDLQQPAEE